MKQVRLEAEDAGALCAGDCCMSAVRRSYEEMCAAGQPASAALDTALAVFHWHHPEVEREAAVLMVRGWVERPEGLRH